MAIVYDTDLPAIKGFLKRRGWEVKKKDELKDYEVLRAYNPQSRMWCILYQSWKKTRLTVPGTSEAIIEAFEKEREERQLRKEKRYANTNSQDAL